MSELRHKIRKIEERLDLVLSDNKLIYGLNAYVRYRSTVPESVEYKVAVDEWHYIDPSERAAEMAEVIEHRIKNTKKRSKQNAVIAALVSWAGGLE